SRAAYRPARPSFVGPLHDDDLAGSQRAELPESAARPFLQRLADVALAHQMAGNAQLLDGVAQPFAAAGAISIALAVEQRDVAADAGVRQLQQRRQPISVGARREDRGGAAALGYAPQVVQRVGQAVFAVGIGQGQGPQQAPLLPAADARRDELGALAVSGEADSPVFV